MTLHICCYPRQLPMTLIDDVFPWHLCMIYIHDTALVSPSMTTTHDTFPRLLSMAPFPWHCEDHALHDTPKVYVGVKHSNVCHCIFSNISSVFVWVICASLLRLTLSLVQVYIWVILHLGYLLLASHKINFDFNLTVYSNNFFQHLPLFLHYFILLQGIDFNQANQVYFVNTCRFNLVLFVL